MSVVFESIRFFQEIPLSNFYLGTVWDPRFTSADDNRGIGQFGFLPLLWGTLYISIIALIVAVPIGLFAAIYLSEYAGPRFRAVAKPLLDAMPGWGLFWLVAGGLAYTAGVAFYAAPRLRYGHFVWHLMVLAGTACHFVAVLRYSA